MDLWEDNDPNVVTALEKLAAPVLELGEAISCAGYYTPRIVKFHTACGEISFRVELHKCPTCGQMCSEEVQP